MALQFPTPTQVGETWTDTSSGNVYVATSLGPPAVWVGSGSSTDLSATFLRKDASNDPVTGQLVITPSTDTTGLVVTQPSGNTTAAMRITNEGSGNSLLVEDSASTDSSPFVINNAGSVGIGTANPQGLLHLGGTGPVLTVDKNGSGTDNCLYYDNTNANNIFFVGRDSSAVVIRTGGTNERLRVTSDATPFLRMAASTGGIQFNGDIAAANALDDYEEGTWTPILVANGTDSTTALQMSGTYTKIGRVWLIRLQVSQASTVPLNWNVGWSRFSGVPVGGINLSLIGVFGSGNLTAQFPQVLTYWTGGQANSDGALTLRSSANTGGADNYYITIFSFIGYA